MTVVQALFLGILQGLTEFLPISSSGHLIFVPKFLGWEDQGLAFDVIVHLGTLVAVVVYFRERVFSMLKSVLFPHAVHQVDFTHGAERSSGPRVSRKLLWYLFVSIIPAGIVGFLFGDRIETYARATWIVGTSLIVWGVVLALADIFSRTHVDRQHDVNRMTWIDAIIIGVAQAIALIPGSSRSGITMTAGLFRHFDRRSAAEFSFLMSIPIIGLAGTMKIFELLQVGIGPLTSVTILVGLLSSAISGFVAIWVLMRLVERVGYIPFALYRIAVGVLILFLL